MIIIIIAKTPFPFAICMVTMDGWVRIQCANYRSKDGGDLLPEDPLLDHLSVLAKVEQPGWVTLEELIKKSENFTIPFPIDTARVKTLHVSCAVE